MIVSRKAKRLTLIAFDMLIISLTHLFSYFFLYPLIQISVRTLLEHLLIVILIYNIIALRTKIFDKINRFTGIRETFIHALILTVSFLSATVVYTSLFEIISLRYTVSAYLISVVLIPGSRIVWRIIIDYERRLEFTGLNKTDPVRTLLIGAGEGGAFFVKALKERLDIDIVGFLDDDRNKQGTTIYGYPVLGRVDELEKTIKRYDIKQVTIAIPSLSKENMNTILVKAHQLGVKTNQMPYIEDILSGDYNMDEFKDIEIADLLGREEVKLDTKAIQQQIAGKTVLVSGAGGSIGSEICRQVVSFSPKRIILLGHGEFSIYNIDYELRQIPDRRFEIERVIADIQDRDRIFEVMEKYKPDIIYHAAAHKHVPLMEENPLEAVKNNVFGTKNLAEAAKAAEVSKFVMISTDKAVNPPNVMGATKRIAEMIVTGLNEENKTNFACVRFGNVLGSSGSVVPVFKEQIEKGGPVTVTDFRMTRYFMTIPEASRLVLQAGAMSEGGEIFVLDMGEPVKILDLARQMIWLSGHTENDIEIVESGIRPGEKLYEELLATDENVQEQIFEKIFVGKVHNLPLEQVYTFIQTISSFTDEQELKDALIHFANRSNEENQKAIEQLTLQTNEKNG
ncbi:MAG TPA: nucleoside-diphosphate sugar epimerase/dehydratase [Atopostipes sp.]|nr:nucleoside-diphosphate sugar epimerase/dehydratase [Atopostipes sp.]